MTLEEFYAICDAIIPDEKGCKNWSGKLSERGYGRVWIDGVGGRNANRLVLERKLGRRIPPGLYALHGCDNPQCVNTEPGHVYEGSHSRNMQDRAERQPESFDNLREWAKSSEGRERLLQWSQSPENVERLRKLNQTPEAKERARAAGRASVDKRRKEAAERRKWIEDFLAKQNEAQP
jgi:hypothetical protein